MDKIVEEHFDVDDIKEEMQLKIKEARNNLMENVTIQLEKEKLRLKKVTKKYLI